jgi:hypothetical protein
MALQPGQLSPEKVKAYLKTNKGKKAVEEAARGLAVRLLKPRKSGQNRRPVEPPGPGVEANGGQTTGPDLRAYPVR